VRLARQPVIDRLMATTSAQPVCHSDGALAGNHAETPPWYFTAKAPFWQHTGSLAHCYAVMLVGRLKVMLP
jgi:hypothetical protein